MGRGELSPLAPSAVSSLSAVFRCSLCCRATCVYIIARPFGYSPPLPHLLYVRDGFRVSLPSGLRLSSLFTAAPPPPPPLARRTLWCDPPSLVRSTHCQSPVISHVPPAHTVPMSTGLHTGICIWYISFSWDSLAVALFANSSSYLRKQPDRNNISQPGSV